MSKSNQEHYRAALLQCFINSPPHCSASATVHYTGVCCSSMDEDNCSSELLQNLIY